ncbi:hypothetical protein AVEN_273408-1 [Araneus ventricosus]|uniref:Uncharacterized protein n=1 Tax=Araneus ventricosus TaxID=182803 RepID=A0A4Y2E0P0_ARAVE|nr:hypothetical protein AVEN_273408-1 [Araneus ventricosus]
MAADVRVFSSLLFAGRGGENAFNSPNKELSSFSFTTIRRMVSLLVLLRRYIPSKLRYSFVNIRPTNWIREDVIFFSAYLKRFQLSKSDQCSCGGAGTALPLPSHCLGI